MTPIIPALRSLHPVLHRRAFAKTGRAPRFLAPLLLLGLASAPLTGAWAANGTWISDADGSWSAATPAPWQDGIVAQGIDSTADFSTVDLTASRTITLAAGLTVGNLLFGDTVVSNHGWTMSSNTLTLDVSAGAPTLTVNGLGTGSVRINSTLAGNDGLTKAGSGTLILAANNTFTGTTTISAGTLQIGADSTTGSLPGDIVNNGTLRIQRGNAITLTGAISGSGALSKLNSAGILTLAGDNTSTGAVTLTDGSILLGSGTNNGLGTGTLSIGRGRFGSADNNARTIANPLTLNLSGSLVFGASQGATDGLGNLVFTDATTGAGPGGGVSVTVNNATVVTLNKAFSSGQFTKAGTGTLELAGVSTTTGATTVNGGTLTVSGSLGNSATTVNSGGTLAGGGTVKNLTLNAGGAIAPGGGNLGTLNTTNGNLTWNGEAAGAFAQMKFTLGNTAADSDRLALGTGILSRGTTGSLFLFDFLGTGVPGNTYTLITFGGSSGFADTDFGATNLPQGLTGTFSLTPNSLQVTVVPEPGVAATLLGGLAALAGFGRARRGTGRSH